MKDNRSPAELSGTAELMGSLCGPVTTSSAFNYNQITLLLFVVVHLTYLY